MRVKPGGQTANDGVGSVAFDYQDNECLVHEIQYDRGLDGVQIYFDSVFLV